MKFCIKCLRSINEKNKNTKWCMIITKKGNEIVAFECFHEKCWKRFFDDAVRIKLKEMGK